jgi:hypothetical protein
LIGIAVVAAPPTCKNYPVDFMKDYCYNNEPMLYTEVMKPKNGQFKKKVISFLDFKIKKTTPFGPMSDAQRNPENRIVHDKVKKENNQ